MLTLSFDDALGEADLVLDSDGALQNGAELETAVLISLHTDRRVSEDTIPEGRSLGGWWGEAFPAVEDDREGSELWAILVQTNGADAPARARAAAEEALAWLLEVGAADEVLVTATRIDGDAIHLHIDIDTSDGRRSFDFTLAPGST